MRRGAEALILALLLCCTLYAGRDRPQRLVPVSSKEEKENEWIRRLIPEAEQEDYAIADIAVKGETAEIIWSSFPDQASLLEALERERTQRLPPADETLCWRFVKIRLEKEAHALDIRDWLAENLSEEGYAFEALTDGEGDSFCFSQIWSYALEEQGILQAKRLLAVRDGYLYGLSCLGVTGQNREAVAQQLLYYEYYCAMKTDALYPGGWFMDDEILYWVDHEERRTRLEDPVRSFVERRAQDVNWPDRIMGLFGMLTEAQYQVRIDPEMPDFTVSFRFIQAIPPEGYSACLLNGFCMDEPYHMEVRDWQGQLIQGKDLQLCIEKTDTVTFEDLDGDGCLDMKILYPRHESESLSEYDYWLWNAQEQGFEEVSESELSKRRLKSREEETDKVAVVRPGDSLWKLAEDRYGDGRRYIDIYRKNESVIGPDPSLIYEGMELEMP